MMNLLYNFSVFIMVIILAVSDAATIHHSMMNTDQLHNTKTIMTNSLAVETNPILNNPYLIDQKAEKRSGEFFPENFITTGKMATPDFDNIPSQFIGPNYAFGNSRLPLMASGLSGIDKSSVINNLPAKDETSNLFGSALKRYDMKKYLLKKILGNSHDLDEDIDDGFFSNKHLKRHGTAGVAAKVLGELIGIKIRESIEGFGKSFSEYAKDFTARNFVTMGQLFGRLFRISQP
ncbi:uncharacterized protein LOC124494524 [Dermatophagoides farinae]|uniref:uncharacterized protein LOC124494524 n=1 Tax=Dermatophagoides farinae TaxID=6954 RepID=UPI003F614577